MLNACRLALKTLPTLARITLPRSPGIYQIQYCTKNNNMKSDLQYSVPVAQPLAQLEKKMQMIYTCKVRKQNEIKVNRTYIQQINVLGVQHAKFTNYLQKSLYSRSCSCQMLGM